MGHQAEAFLRINHDNKVGRMHSPFVGRCTRNQSTRMHYAGTRCLQDGWIRTAAARAKPPAKIPFRTALATALIRDAVRITGPVQVIQATLSTTSDTCEDSTPPSPCNNASVAFLACRFPARLVSWRCVST